MTPHISGMVIDKTCLCEKLSIIFFLCVDVCLSAIVVGHVNLSHQFHKDFFLGPAWSSDGKSKIYIRFEFG